VQTKNQVAGATKSKAWSTNHQIDRVEKKKKKKKGCLATCHKEVLKP